MKLLFILLLFAAPCFMTELIYIDEVGSLFYKQVRGDLTPKDEVKINKVFELIQGDFNSLQELNSHPHRATIVCIICRGTIQAFIDDVRAGASNEQLTNTFAHLCVSLQIMESYDVCHGAVALNMPILTYIVRNEPAVTPATFCGLVLQSDSNPNECPITDPRFEWTVDLPPPIEIPQDNKITETNDRDLKVALIADFHIDPLYEAGGVGNCDQPTCCRRGQKEATSYEYRSNYDRSFTDDAYSVVDDTIMLDLDYAEEVKRMKRSSRNRFVRNAAPAGYWGDYRNCDTPLWAYDDVVERIAESHKDIDIIYYMGDTVDHGVWETSYELINNMNDYVIKKLIDTFGPNIPVLPIIGNHESNPTNQFAPPSILEPGIDTHWLYDALAEKWSPYLDEAAKVTLRDRGDYTMLVKPGLRVISINSNVPYTMNWWVMFDPQECKRHLDWLVDELTKAEIAGEKVHILSHIAPGSGDLIKSWTREYNRIINRFSSVISAEFNGHTHSDEFRIFYSLNDRSPINMAWIVGAATSYSDYNLNYKIATIDRNTYEPLNFESYIYNLTEANLTPHRRPHWFQLYDFRNSYNLQSLSAADMNNLVQRMATTDRHLIDLYSAYSSKLSDTRLPGCQTGCKRSLLCRSVITDLWERERCNELENLYN